jgi:hypothetical protein
MRDHLTERQALSLFSFVWLSPSLNQLLNLSASILSLLSITTSNRPAAMAGSKEDCIAGAIPNHAQESRRIPNPPEIKTAFSIAQHCYLTRICYSSIIQQPNSPFLILPAKIHNAIYAYATWRNLTSAVSHPIVPFHTCHTRPNTTDLHSFKLSHDFDREPGPPSMRWAYSNLQRLHSPVSLAKVYGRIII